MIATSPDGFNKNLDDNVITDPEEILSRRRRDIWEDEEDEDNY